MMMLGDSGCLNYGVFVYLIVHIASFLCSATIINSKYRVVTKTIEQNHVGSVLGTSYWNSKLGCAQTCDTSRCISFSYNSFTRECKTYGEEICYMENGATSSTVKFYTKVVNFENLNHCGDIPTVYCSGVYPLNIGSGFDVSCDLDTSGGPWTIIANRYDGSVDFYKGWSYYKNGFGSLSGEFWLGFENLLHLLAQGMKLRIEMQGWSGPVKYVEYTSFHILDEANKYTLLVSGFSTPDGLGDFLAPHHGYKFTTLDSDNDDYDEGNCAHSANGAWWYNACIDSNLFGTYTSNNGYQSMVWKYFYATTEEYTGVKTVRMMLRKA